MMGSTVEGVSSMEVPEDKSERGCRLEVRLQGEP
jgi:hypothetical protein